MLTAGGDRRAVDTTARRRPRLHVAFTYAGLAALGVPDDMLASFPDEFREGMAARAERLGDRGPSAPENWEPGLGTGEAHVLVTVYAVDNEHLDERARRCCAVRPGAERRDRRCQRAARGGAARRQDHFGFFDGIAQPAIAGSGVEARPGDGQPDGAGGWRDVAHGRVPARPHRRGRRRCPTRRPAPFDRNGTFDGLPQAADGRRRVPRATWRTRRRDYPGGPEHARGQDRRPLDATGRRSSLSPDGPDPDDRRRPAADQRLLLRRRPGGAALPARRPHPPRQPARRRRASSSGQLSEPPPHHPPRPHRTGRRCPTDVMEDDGEERGLVFSCFQTRASGASSRPSRRSGSTTATRSASAPTRTSSIGEPARHDGQDDDPGPPAVLPQARSRAS